MKDIGKRITSRLTASLLSERVLDNTIRGVWCEFMVAEALGPDCLAVGLGWNAWDLQLGPATANYPERIRIQVKNSARLQIWNDDNGKVSDCTFHLRYRNCPAYLRHSYSPPCEPSGFLCEVFVLCYHPEEDRNVANHLDPMQWRFYVVPVVGPKSGVTEKEKAWAAATLARRGKPASCDRKPGTLEKALRGRPPVNALTFDQLSTAAIRESLGLCSTVTGADIGGSLQR